MGRQLLGGAGDDPIKTMELVEIVDIPTGPRFSAQGYISPADEPGRISCKPPDDPLNRAFPTYYWDATGPGFPAGTVVTFIRRSDSYPIVAVGAICEEHMLQVELEQDGQMVQLWILPEHLRVLP